MKQVRFMITFAWGIALSSLWHWALFLTYSPIEPISYRSAPAIWLPTIILTVVTFFVAVCYILNNWHKE